MWRNFMGNIKLIKYCEFLQQERMKIKRYNVRGFEETFSEWKFFFYFLLYHFKTRLLAYTTIFYSRLKWFYRAKHISGWPIFLTSILEMNYQIRETRTFLNFPQRIFRPMNLWRKAWRRPKIRIYFTKKWRKPAVHFSKLPQKNTKPPVQGQRNKSQSRQRRDSANRSLSNIPITWPPPTLEEKWTKSQDFSNSFRSVQNPESEKSPRISRSPKKFQPFSVGS